MKTVFCMESTATKKDSEMLDETKVDKKEMAPAGQMGGSASLLSAFG